VPLIRPFLEGYGAGLYAAHRDQPHLLIWALPRIGHLDPLYRGMAAEFAAREGERRDAAMAALMATAPQVADNLLPHLVVGERFLSWARWGHRLRRIPGCRWTHGAELDQPEPDLPLHEVLWRSRPSRTRRNGLRLSLHSDACVEEQVPVRLSWPEPPSHP